MLAKWSEVELNLLILVVDFKKRKGAAQCSVNGRFVQGSSEYSTCLAGIPKGALKNQPL